MSDPRSLRDKLRAMAEQRDQSPNEAEIAERLLAQGAGDREPPRRPPAGAPQPIGPEGSFNTYVTTTTTTTSNSAWGFGSFTIVEPGTRNTR